MVLEHWIERLGVCASVAVRDVMCEVCSSTFRRQSDKARHKCVEERKKPVREQQGAIQCSHCFRWFRSRGGLTVYTDV